MTTNTSAPGTPAATPDELAAPDATTTARTIVAQLIASGVRIFVLCPGSRSAPVAYALADAEAAGLVRLHVETDERVAGFVALGCAQAGELAAVVTTSGSAVANLHPAVEEAYYGAVPLIVLSSDRPHDMRGVRASQTSDHQQVLAGSVRMFREFPAHGSLGNCAGLIRRAVRAARGEGTGNVPGPVHLNVSFTEPLMPSDSWQTVATDIAHAQRQNSRDYQLGRTVIIAGSTTQMSDLDPQLLAQVPILAEPSAPLRAHENAVFAHPILLRSQLRAGIENVIVVGHPTLTRDVSQLLADSQVQVYALDDAPTYADVSGQAHVISPDEFVHVVAPDPQWLAAWQQASTAATEFIRAHCQDLSYASIGWQVSVRSREIATVVGASSIIREINLYGPVPAPPLYANRGLAGIDGTMSTAVGISLATGQCVRVVLGDITFIHDLGALVHTAGQQRANLDIVMIDDAGGSLFATLEYGSGSEEIYDRVFRTAKELDVPAYATAVGVDYLPVRTHAELVDALAVKPVGVRLVHVQLARTAMATERAARAQIQQGVLDAVHRGLKDFQ